MTEPPESPKCSLYRFYDANDRLLYVGITHRLPARMSEHSASGNEWWWQVVRISVEHHETRVEALTAEATAIANERPVWNRVGRLPVSHEALFGSDGDMQIDDRAAAAAMSGALRPLVDGIHKERHFLPSKARQHQSAPQRQKRS